MRNILPSQLQKMFHTCLNKSKVKPLQLYNSNFFKIVLIHCTTEFLYRCWLWFWNLLPTDKSYTSKRKCNLERKNESKPKRSKSRTAKGETPINSVCDSTKASHSSQMSQCMVYSKENTDNNLVPETVTAIGGRDTALFLFRALGKILYCKSEWCLLHY